MKNKFKPRRREARQDEPVDPITEARDWIKNSTEQNSNRVDLEEIAREIVDSAIKVHRAIGPGLLESAYQYCLSYELRKRKRNVPCEVLVPIFYDGQKIDAGYRIDMLVENKVIIENKTVDQLLPIHEAQLLTYLRMKQCPIGFLLNWNVNLIKDGIKRMVNCL